MNVRAAFVRGFPRRHRMVHDIAGFLHEVRRLRCVGLRGLFDHDVIDVQKR